MIEVKNVFAGYGKRTVIYDISLNFEKGKLTTVIGPNGSGKSTLIKSVVGIIPQISGSVTIDGKNSKSLKRIDTARHISYLSQSRDVPDMTVFELVLHGRFPYLGFPRIYRENDKAIAKKVMESIGISEYADTPLSSLSGGIRQNAYIAMALVQDTDYVFLDEPMTHLDIAHRLSLMKSLKALTELGKGIILVTHELPLAFGYSDSVAVIKSGRLTAVGNPREIAESDIPNEVFGLPLRYEKGLYFYDLEADLPRP